MLSTLAGTHQGSYKLLTERAQHDMSLKQLETEMWESFKNDTPFGSIVSDIETAFSTYSRNILGRMPGMEVCPSAKLRPDLSGTRFVQAGINGKLFILLNRCLI